MTRALDVSASGRELEASALLARCLSSVIGLSHDYVATAPEPPPSQTSFVPTPIVLPETNAPPQEGSTAQPYESMRPRLLTSGGFGYLYGFNGRTDLNGERVRILHGAGVSLSFEENITRHLEAVGETESTDGRVAVLIVHTNEIVRVRPERLITDADLRAVAKSIRAECVEDLLEVSACDEVEVRCAESRMHGAWPRREQTDSGAGAEQEVPHSGPHRHGHRVKA